MRNRYDRINEYRVMWVIVMYDLPMVTEREKRNYTVFRKKMLRDGFLRFQFSMYLRHCSSSENADVHVKRVRSFLPPEGHIGVISITDKQFGMMEVFHGKVRTKAPTASRQLEMF
jgi:CRISPR-associated protein Cas2